MIITCPRCSSPYDSDSRRCPQCALPTGSSAAPYSPPTPEETSLLAKMESVETGSLSLLRPLLGLAALAVLLLLFFAAIFLDSDKDSKGDESSAKISNRSVLTGIFLPEEICIAAIAKSNNQIVKGITARRIDPETLQVFYTRNADNRTFTYLCRIEANEVRWKCPDIGVPNWSKNLRVFFATKSNGTILEIKETLMGEEMSVKTFSKNDFD